MSDNNRKWQARQKQHGSLLIVEPKDELRINGPYDRPVMTFFSLINETPLPVAFKVKTTEPKRYSVKPVFGIIKPHSRVKIKVLFQTLIGPDGREINVAGPGAVPAIFDRKRQKFMIQSVFVIDGSTNALQILKDAIQTRPSELMDNRFRCTFDEQELTQLAFMDARMPSLKSNPIRTPQSEQRQSLVGENENELFSRRRSMTEIDKTSAGFDSPNRQPQPVGQSLSLSLLNLNQKSKILFVIVFALLVTIAIRALLK